MNKRQASHSTTRPVTDRHARGPAPIARGLVVPMAHTGMHDAAHGCVDWFIYPSRPGSAEARR